MSDAICEVKYYGNTFFVHEKNNDTNHIHHIVIDNISFPIVGKIGKDLCHAEILFKNSTFNRSSITMNDKYEITRIIVKETQIFIWEKYIVKINYFVNGKKRVKTLKTCVSKIYNDTTEAREFKYKRNSYEEINKILKDYKIPYNIKTEQSYERLEKMIFESDIKTIFQKAHRKEKLKNLFKK